MKLSNEQLDLLSTDIIIDGLESVESKLLANGHNQKEVDDIIHQINVFDSKFDGDDYV